MAPFEEEVFKPLSPPANQKTIAGQIPINTSSNLSTQQEFVENVRLTQNMKRNIAITSISGTGTLTDQNPLMLFSDAVNTTTFFTVQGNNINDPYLINMQFPFAVPISAWFVGYELVDVSGAGTTNIIKLEYYDDVKQAWTTLYTDSKTTATANKRGIAFTNPFYARQIRISLANASSNRITVYPMFLFV